ncbi:MAG: tRNA (N(6)-L-threonylcarbamoyladenosine(37)-C(2))-methylthiotransferase [Methanolinea sp.]|nr:tRNA (N(6)-L-threonylcarbamoyladenosine(37)-C(2))-methylthiotransferase [Methanolinea sp.]
MPWMGDGSHGADSKKAGDSRGALRALAEKKVFLRTFGCTYNAGDSWKLAEVLKAQGCTLVDDPCLADAIVLNTCAVVGRTERKVLAEVRRHEGRPVYVTGCMPLALPGAFAATRRPVVTIHPDEIHAAWAKVNTVPAGPVGIVQACRGCLGSCTYCITRRARGVLESRDPREILSETARLVAAGAFEVRLTGQDLAAWGKDTGQSLPSLLHALNSLPGHFMVRPGMMNPATLYPAREGVAEAFTLPKIFATLHLPVQSGSMGVLRRMQREYTPAEVLEIVEVFREAVPGLSLTTDIICGFPGETEGEFEETLGLLREVRPDRVIVTRYSPRPGTPAAGEVDMPDRVKKERSRRLLALAVEIARGENARWVGRTVPVVVTERLRPGTSMGRTREYRGVVIGGEYPPGTVLPVRILSDHVYYFRGQPV